MFCSRFLHLMFLFFVVLTLGWRIIVDFGGGEGIANLKRRPGASQDADCLRPDGRLWILAEEKEIADLKRRPAPLRMLIACGVRISADFFSSSYLLYLRG